MSKTEKYERVHYITDRPFAEELQHLIDNPPMGSMPLEITPAMATEMLKRNTRNRGYRPHRALDMAKQIAAGDWYDTGATIVFCKSGHLGDGQHRLGGIVESGVTVKAQVVFGVPDDAFPYMDIGARRTASDVFKINGVENSVLMAAAISKFAAIKYIWGRGLLAKTPGKSNAELFELYLDHTGLQRSAKFGRAFSKTKYLETSLATALHYTCALRCRAVADLFFKKAADGFGILKGSEPEARLRDRLDENAKSIGKMSARHKAALTLIAWNFRRAGISAGTISYDESTPFPRAH